MGFPGPTETLIVLGVGLVVFGTARLPKMARSLGEAIKEFRSVKKEIQEDLDLR